MNINLFSGEEIMNTHGFCAGSLTKLISALKLVLGCINQQQFLRRALIQSCALFLGSSCLLEVGKMFAPLARLVF